MKIMPRALVVALTILLGHASAIASAIGQTVSSRVSVSNYQQILDNELFTHLGMNKGLGGAEHDPCRTNIANRLQSYGYSVELHPFTYNAVTYFNVIGTKVGHTFPNQQFIVSGHYDTVGNPGADDDASGIAAMLEIARVFSQFDTAYTIKFCAWDREEQGKIGSTAYVNTHPGAQIVSMVQLDMIAHDVGNNQENIYGNAAALPLKQALQSAAGLYGNGIVIANAGDATFSDHAPFAAAGYQAVCFVEHNFTQFGCYHQPCDSVDTPNYIHYSFAANLARTVAGHLADAAQASKLGDVTGDGIVNIADLLAVIAAWGACAPATGTCPADIPRVPGGTGDGVVNISDLLAVIANWG
jgi:hypothetical protein